MSPMRIALDHTIVPAADRRASAVLARIQARGIDYRSLPHGPVDKQVNTQHGGRIVYWGQPDGHVWEMLTVSYARQR